MIFWSCHTDVGPKISPKNGSIYKALRSRGRIFFMTKCACDVVLIWVFENSFVVTHPRNSCESRAPLGLPRSRCGATPHPHSSPSLFPADNGCRAQLSERGSLYVGVPGTDRSLPGMVENREERETPALYQRTNACAAVHPSLHDTGTTFVPTHVRAAE